MQVYLEDVSFMLSSFVDWEALQEYCSTVLQKSLYGMQASLALWTFANVQRHMHLIQIQMLMGQLL